LSDFKTARVGLGVPVCRRSLLLMDTAEVSSTIKCLIDREVKNAEDHITNAFGAYSCVQANRVCSDDYSDGLMAIGRFGAHIKQPLVAHDRLVLEHQFT
jgi:hypothetical protein